jgi:predicted RNA binding protein YcfA (HicA-like mRNA interferase family)
VTPKLPVVSGREAIVRFQRMGYKVVRRKGSHIRLMHPIDAARKPLTVPDHKTLGKGLLHKLLRDAGITVDDFLCL